MVPGSRVGSISHLQQSKADHFAEKSHKDFLNTTAVNKVYILFHHTLISAKHFPSATRIFCHIYKILELCEAVFNIHTCLIHCARLVIWHISLWEGKKEAKSQKYPAPCVCHCCISYTASFRMFHYECLQKRLYLRCLAEAPSVHVSMHFMPLKIKIEIGTEKSIMLKRIFFILFFH